MSQTPAQSDALVITGASGRIGTALIARLTPRYRVVALDVKPPDEPLPDGAEFRELDLTSDTRVGMVADELPELAAGPIASVVHLAAYYDFSGEPSDLYEQVTVRGTERLLRALRPLRPQQFVFSSTMLVHAPTEPHLPISEDSPIEAKWDYPKSKVETERVIRNERGAIPAAILRIAGVYTDVCDSIPIAHQIQRIYEDLLVSRVYPGDASRGQAFVHMDDLVEAIRLTIERRRELPEEVPILIGEPETCSYQQIQDELGRLIHGKDHWPTEHIPKAVAKTGAWVQDHVPGLEEPFIKPWMIDLADDHYELDISRARRLLGWEPSHRLLATLPLMVEALNNDPIAWYERHDLGAPPASRMREQVRRHG